MAMTTITNRKPGKCEACAESVAIGQGYAVLNKEKWIVVCRKRVCHGKLGLIDEAREMKKDGTVRCPKDPESIKLLRSLPGGRWDHKNKLWRFSLSIEHRRRVLEVGEKLGLKIDAELFDYALPDVAKDAARRAQTAGLYPYQRIGVEFLTLNRRALLADDQGIGKTIQAIVSLPENAPSLIVCPKSMKATWRDECLKWRPDLLPVLLDGKKDFRVPTKNEVFITNDEALPVWLVQEEPGKLIVPEGIDIGALRKVSLIYDEAHRAKNYDSQRSKKIGMLRKLCARAAFLTGTPLMSKPPDLYGVLAALGVHLDVFNDFGHFERLFQARTVRHGRTIFDTHVEYGEADPEVHERLKRVMLRRLRKDVLPDLPDKMYRTIPVTGFSKSVKNKLDELYEEHRDVLDRMKLPPLEYQSTIYKLLAEVRIDAMIEVVESYESSGTPLVVFSVHRAPIEVLGKREGWAAITGSVSGEDRKESVDLFQNGKLFGLALVMGAGGTGLTLTHASDALFVDLSWTPSDNVQAEDRLVRIGQKSKKVLINRLVSDHPLEKHIHKVIDLKNRIISSAIKASDYEIQGDYTIQGDYSGKET